MNQSTLIDENDFQNSNSIWRHFGEFILIIIVVRTILFTLGTFIENGTFGIALLTLAYLFGFSISSILMIKTYRRSTRLNIVEKIFAVVILFIGYEIFANLIHLVYFTLILGQNPSINEVLNKTLEILQYDSYILVLTIVLAVFINSKVIKDS